MREHEGVRKVKIRAVEKGKGHKGRPGIERVGTGASKEGAPEGNGRKGGKRIWG